MLTLLGMYLQDDISSMSIFSGKNSKEEELLFVLLKIHWGKHLAEFVICKFKYEQSLSFSNSYECEK